MKLNRFLILTLFYLIALIKITNPNCCNNCKINCAIVGRFTIANCASGTILFNPCPSTNLSVCLNPTTLQIVNPAILSQCGSNFLVNGTNSALIPVTPEDPFVVRLSSIPNQYIITFNQQFCSKLAITVNSTSGRATVSSTTRPNSFLLNNIFPGESVSFIAVPISKSN